MYISVNEYKYMFVMNHLDQIKSFYVCINIALVHVKIYKKIMRV